jgi:hypothetical protein
MGEPTIVDILNSYSENDKAIHSSLTNGQGALILDYTNFNKYKNAHKNFDYIKSLKLGIYEEIIKKLEPRIHKYGYVWNSEKEKYLKPINHLTESNSRLKGLIGCWMGFSWNKERTEENSENIAQYNIFRMEISTDLKVHCQTKNADFTIGFIHLISDDRLTIEISTPNNSRKAYFTGAIGKNSDLSKQEILSVTYTDTGNDHEVKCGPALLKKVNCDFLSIEIGSKPINNISDKSLVDRLNGKQLSAIKFAS